jgi:ATP-dependent protease ClpP protease subunit
MLLKIDGVITKDTLTQVRAALSTNEAIELHIDSPGGDLFSGLAIFEALSNYDEDVKIYVDNVAGSIASIIALAGKRKPDISENGSFVIHNAHVEKTAGNHNDLRKVANSLEKYSEIVANIYAKKTGQSPEDIAQAMNEETVFKSADAIAFGLAGDVFNPIKALAQINHIDMTILERIKNNLTGEEAPAVEPLNVEGEEAPTEAALTEEMKAEITELVKTLIAEALGGQTENLKEGLAEEIGNSIATIFNEIKSNGVPPSAAQVTEPAPAGKVDGVTAFNKKMNEIKSKTI